MIDTRKLIVAATFMLGLAPWTSTGLLAAESETLDFQEVYGLVKSQLPELGTNDLDDAAARGLIQQLFPRIRLQSAETEEPAEGASNRADARVFDDSVGYIHLPHFVGETGALWRESVATLQRSNTLAGLVIDLRFADGIHYEAARAVADSFMEEETGLLDWGAGMKSSTAKTNAFKFPVAVLVNAQTAEAAEALAALLRHHGLGLIIGSRTAGQAYMYRDFKLSSGQHLQIASQPVQLANQEPAGEGGLRPDIVVAADPARERLWIADPYARPVAATAAQPQPTEANEGLASTNRTNRRRLNEADLVRILREGELPVWPEDSNSENGGEPGSPQVQDPALARALDFLKGLAVVRRFQRQ